MSIRTAWRYFKLRSKVPRLPSDLITPFDVTAASDDELLLIMTGRVKDIHGINRLMKRHGVQRAAELIPLLPERKAKPLRERVMDWLRRIEGSTDYDPIRHHLRREKNTFGGITRNRFR